MNIDDLTIGEVKQLQSLIGGNAASKPDIYTPYIGKYVICRTRNEGINAGKVIAIDETGVVLEDARRLWYHKPRNPELSWYEGIAKDGVSDDSKVSEPVTKVIAEDYSITLCTEAAEKSIREAKTHAQS